MSDLNFEVRDPEVEKVLRKIGGLIGQAIPESHGFVLLVYNHGEGGNMFYISNSQREGVIEAMKEFIEKNS